jgi:hypothetical protein
MKKLAFVLSMVLGVLLFSGCVTILSSDTTVNLDKNEKWAVNQELLFEGESFVEYGEAVIDGLNLLTAEGLNTGLDIEFEQLPDRQGNIPYRVTISGEGLDKLNEIFGTPGAFTKTEVDGEILVEFELDATNLSSGGLDIGFAPELTFNIEGLKIVTTNGKKNSPTSVTWENPNAIMRATFTTATSKGMAFPWWVILVIVVGLAAIVLVILLATGVFKKKKPLTVYGTPYGTPPVNAPPIPQTNTMETIVASRGGKQQVPPIPQTATEPPPLPPQSNLPPPLPPVHE